VHYTKATDDWMRQIAGMKKLKFLDLGNTLITDVGLLHLAKCQDLSTLLVQKTKTTEKGLADFHAVALACRIEHDGGVIAADPDRRVAQWALSVGGTVQVNGRAAEIKAGTDLPKERFALSYLNLGQIKEVADADLARLRDCQKLSAIVLGQT